MKGRRERIYDSYRTLTSTHTITKEAYRNYVMVAESARRKINPKGKECVEATSILGHKDARKLVCYRHLRAEVVLERSK